MNKDLEYLIGNSGYDHRLSGSVEIRRATDIRIKWISKNGLIRDNATEKSMLPSIERGKIVLRKWQDCWCETSSNVPIRKWLFADSGFYFVGRYVVIRVNYRIDPLCRAKLKVLVFKKNPSGRIVKVSLTDTDFINTVSGYATMHRMQGAE